MNFWQQTREFLGILSIPLRLALSSLGLRWGVWRRNYQIHYAVMLYDAKLEKLKAENAPEEEIENCENERNTELFELDEISKKLRTQYLTLTARRLSLPLPDYRDESAWEDHVASTGKHLTEKSERELRAAIREEIRERSENSRLWLAGLTGRAGAVAGLIALLVGRR